MRTPASHSEEFPRIRLGVSACLLGEPVRYDGGHKRHAFLTDVLASHADYLPVCPEAGIGMGIPRPPIHLVGNRQRPRALGLDDPSLDVTTALESFAVATLGRLHDASGYVFKKNSPSCGLRQVKLSARPGYPARRQGTGIFARVVGDSLPLLPITEEDCFDDPQRRENFICRVYVYRRWQDLQVRGLSAAGLLDFHAAHRYLIMTHSEAACRRLEKLMSELSAPRLADTAAVYIRELMATLARPSQRARHAKVLQQLASDLEPRINRRQSTALASRLNAYRDGGLPLGEAIAALRGQFERNPDIDKPVYLYPYPDSLRLRHLL
jgi:uncharacterized protein YbbK (DUF523 family)/uncharacterized protein YbgA (DUF1722 family)